MLLFIDNYDSFTYNIVQYFAELGQEVLVRCNDEITIEEIEALKPQYLVIGPGPCSPKEAGISVAAMQHFAGRLPVMGVCLGHQTMGEAFGGNVVRAQTMMHGKVSPVFHHGTGMFKDLPNPVNCTRYHSLAIDRTTLPDCLEITAWTEDGESWAYATKNMPLRRTVPPRSPADRTRPRYAEKLLGRIQRLSPAKILMKGRLKGV